MKFLTAEQRNQIAGEYFSPEGLYEYTKKLPFTGRVKSDVTSLVAGEWTEIALDYEVGASGLADGAWIKGTFKFYSDWALFQTSDPQADNYISAEYVPNALLPGQTPATVQLLGIRFDQKGHERPFQKAIIVDIQDGYLNPGDRIVIRLGGSALWGQGDTRANIHRKKTFAGGSTLTLWVLREYHDGRCWEKEKSLIAYGIPVDSRFAPIQPDLSWEIIAGPIHHLQVVSPRLMQRSVPFKIHAHAEDAWGNVTQNVAGLLFTLKVSTTNSDEAVVVIEKILPIPASGWTNAVFQSLLLEVPEDYIIDVTAQAADGAIVASKRAYITVSPAPSVPLLLPKILFGDLHVHSDDTVGTESSTYNFSYGRDIAGLDVLGYTANDFQITKARWDATVDLIRTLNQQRDFVIFAGTEWCGNSAAGGDHNVVFLNDESLPEFPLDRHGNVARSFEWSEDGPKDLVPGAWPLDEVYLTYAGEAENHLLIPHVGGRRCNLAWHHPKLERLVEIGSAWGQFEWLLQDAIRRGWKLGVCANSDEHRGRCGGGVPGTAVFGTRGGLTGILAPRLERRDVAKALRARHTFATTGQRLVGLLYTGSAIQGDEIQHSAKEPLELDYHFLGEKGFSSIEAFDASGLIWRRHFWSESKSPASILRVTWGGARLYDRYREAIWNGRIDVSTSVHSVLPFGGLEDNIEDHARQAGANTITFSSKTSGDLDGVHITFEKDQTPRTITVSGTIGGYVKVGDALAGNPHKAQPAFRLEASWQEAQAPDGKVIQILGGAGLFVRVEAIPEVVLPRRVQGRAIFHSRNEEKQSIYFVGREWSGEKVVTSPIFVDYRDLAEES